MAEEISLKLAHYVGCVAISLWEWICLKTDLLFLFSRGSLRSLVSLCSLASLQSPATCIGVYTKSYLYLYLYLPPRRPPSRSRSCQGGTCSRGQKIWPGALTRSGHKSGGKNLLVEMGLFWPRQNQPWNVLAKIWPGAHPYHPPSISFQTVYHLSSTNHHPPSTMETKKWMRRSGRKESCQHVCPKSCQQYSTIFYVSSQR